MLPERLSPALRLSRFKVAFTSTELTAEAPPYAEQPGFHGLETRFSQTTDKFPDVLRPHREEREEVRPIGLS